MSGVTSLILTYLAMLVIMSIGAKLLGSDVKSFAIRVHPSFSSSAMRAGSRDTTRTSPQQRTNWRRSRSPGL